jgi:tRNA(Ile)-lysidine synthase
MLLKRLAQTAAEKCGLLKTQQILCGVSGGADSLALLFGLQALGYQLAIAHVDHGLRPESQAEARFVQQIADSQKLPFFLQCIDVGHVAKLEGQSIEEAARVVRYQFLFEQARVHHCQAVAVAHHADDQVETVLMHLMRGAALPGLTGMSYQRLMPQWDDKIPLVRPLLDTWREEIDAYIAEIGLTPCNDLSNLDTTYHRNRIRHELIPYLESYNPQIKAVIWRMADVLNEEDRFLTCHTEEAYEQCLHGETEDRITLNLKLFKDLSTALKRRVLRQAIAQLRPDLRDIGFDAIARGLAFLERPIVRGEIDLVARLNLAVIDEMLLIKTWDADLPDLGQPLLLNALFDDQLTLEKSINLRHGWRIEASLLENRPDRLLDVVKNLPPDEAWLDYDLVNIPMVVRGRKEGECFRPLGMDGHTQGLQDFFTNLKIPEHIRSLWPLVICGQKVAWVVGLRPSDDFKITASTQKILKLKVTT